VSLLKALRLYGKGDLRLEEVESPSPASGEIILRVRATSICATDIKAYSFGSRTKLPLTLGHEVSGDVCEVGEGLEHYSGKRVTLNPNVFCGKCHYCLTGEHVLCGSRYAIGIDVDGSFAEYLKVPAQALRVGCVQEVPPGVDYEEASLVEPLSCCLRGQIKLGVGSGDVVTVIGAGPIGLMHLKLAKLSNASKVIVSEVEELRIKRAEAMGADHVVDPRHEDLERSILGLTRGRGSDVVIVAVGSPDAQRDALRIVGRGGRINFFAGLPAGMEVVPLDTNVIHYRQVIVLGTSMSTPHEFKRALDIVGSGLVDLKPFVTHRFKLEEGLDAFATAMRRDSLKVVLMPRGDL
jgi:L-iditol 2-dehydrogenase